MFKYQGVNFITIVRRPYPPLMNSLFFLGFNNRKAWHKFLSINYKLSDVLAINDNICYPDYHLRTFSQKVVKHLFHSPQNFLHLKKETLNREKKVLSNRAKIDIKTGQDIKKFFFDFLDYMPTLALYFICDDAIENGLRIELLKKTSALEVDGLLSKLNLPLQFNLDRKMKHWFLKTRDIDGFIKKYSWNFSRFGKHHLVSRQEAINFLRSLQKDKSLAKEDEGRVATRQAIKRAKKLLGAKAYYVDIMQFFVYYRTQRTDILNKAFFSYYDSLSALAKKLGIDYEDIINCSYEELINNQIPRRLILDARKKDVVTCFSHGQLKIISGKAVDYFKKLSQEKEIKEIISGRAAFLGRAIGRVMIVKDKTDFKNFKTGNILVASMTTPNMMPIMKKAAAFVTDEGGITCHAAILSRELKKPCIIGTKNATQLLRNGDLVEVDADRGLVKKVK